MLLIAAALASATSSTAELDPFLGSCAAQGMRLWQRSLCAPVVIVDPATGRYRSSQPAPAEPLPAMRANTAFKWGGADWIMVLEPLPPDPVELASLLFHEAWHVRQAQLGFPANSAVAAHLDDATNRYLIRLEWAALARALQARGAGGRAHAAQALAFRKQRLARDPKAADAERDQMRHEGVAAYTGAALSGASQRLALEALKSGARRPALGRSFAYASGPAWGLLLDRHRPDWRRLKTKLDLPEMMPLEAAAAARADDYGGTAILAEETLAAAERARRIKAAMAATAPARALRLPLAQMSMDFDPNRVSSGPDGSSLYEKINLGDRWGRIRIDGTPLRIAPDFTAAFAPWPLPSGALELAKGWRVEEQAGAGAALVPPG